MKILFKTISLFFLLTSYTTDAQNTKERSQYILEEEQENTTTDFVPQNFYDSLSIAALSIVNPDIIYDGRYFDMEYPMGDIPEKYGVCTDVIIRSYRKLNIDLQQELHEDIKSNKSRYPNISRADYKIDHRRVPNLSRFFSEYGEILEVTKNSEDYKAGDIVYWKLGGKTDHIGIVTHIKSKNGTPLMVHNICCGQNLDDCLFEYNIYKHFRYKK